MSDEQLDKTELARQQFEERDGMGIGGRRAFIDKSPCGHYKNFLIGDERGNFTCVLCELKAVRLDRDRLQSRVDKLIDPISGSEYRGF